MRQGAHQQWGQVWQGRLASTSPRTLDHWTAGPSSFRSSGKVEQVGREENLLWAAQCQGQASPCPSTVRAGKPGRDGTCLEAQAALLGSHSSQVPLGLAAGICGEKQRGGDSGVFLTIS